MSIKNVMKRYQGRIVTISEENGKSVAILELDERIIPRWDMSPKVVSRMAFVCQSCELDVGEEVEVLVTKK